MRRLSAALSWVLVAFVRVYQRAIRPVLPPMCRFWPSCSEYMVLAIRKYGPIRGAWKGARRVCRCHPWNEGGYDPP